MRRFVIGVVLAAAAVLAARKMGPAMRARCGEACERMLANMPESFPPNRMMADLAAIKEQTARIADLVEPPPDDQSTRSPSLRQDSISRPAPSA